MKLPKRSQEHICYSLHESASDQDNEVRAFRKKNKQLPGLKENLAKSERKREQTSKMNEDAFSKRAPQAVKPSASVDSLNAEKS